MPVVWLPECRDHRRPGNVVRAASRASFSWSTHSAAHMPFKRHCWAERSVGAKPLKNWRSLAGPSQIFDMQFVNYLNNLKTFSQRDVGRFVGRCGGQGKDQARRAVARPCSGCSSGTQSVAACRGPATGSISRPSPRASSQSRSPAATDRPRSAMVATGATPVFLPSAPAHARRAVPDLPSCPRCGAVMGIASVPPGFGLLAGRILQCEKCDHLELIAPRSIDD